MIELIRQSGLFDEEYYRTQAPKAGGDLVRHYVEKGAALHLNPHRLFSTEWYRLTNHDLTNGPHNPLEHFVRWGAKEGRSPHPLFSIPYYMKAHPAYVEAWDNPLAYYLTQGAASFPDPHPLFDTKFYLAKNPDVQALNINPLLHYLSSGWAGGRDPHPLFDSRWYLKQNPDVAASGMNPLVHWVWHGAKELRDPHPLFDTSFYTSQFSGLEGMNPVEHYMARGASLGADPHPLFLTTRYVRQNPDVAASEVNPLVHFLAEGAVEGRDPHPLFNIGFYREQARGLPLDQNALVHYLEAGAHRGLDPDPRFRTSFYAASYASELNPLVHYVLFGQKAALLPHPDFPPGIAPEAIDFTPPDVSGIRRVRESARNTAALPWRPVISILLPTFNTPSRLLTLAVDSVFTQSYENWELCICDDGSTNPETLHTLKNLEHSDPRISVIRSACNGGISHATNAALANAGGEFVAMLDHDDEFVPDALAQVAARLNEDPLLDVIYSDQEYRNEDGTFSGSFFKPDWSPAFFQGVMYVGHLLVVRRNSALEAGGFDPAFDFVQDFEFMLRLSEKTRKICHIPQVLYRWRRIPGSVAAGTEEKCGIPELQARAVNRHFERTGFRAAATPNPALAHRLLIGPASGGSGSEREVRVTILDPSELAALSPDFSDFIILKRREVRPLTNNWIDNLLLYARLPDAGCVSALILDAHDKVSNAGLIVGPGAGIRAAMEGLDSGSDGYAGSLASAREVSAVSDDCVMLAREKLEAFGVRADFLTTFYRVADLSVRMAQSGLRNIHNPRAVMQVADGGASAADDLLDRELFRDSWQARFRQGDPFHNRNFAHSNFGAASRPISSSA